MGWLDDDQRQQFESQIDVVEKELCTPIATEKRRFSSNDRLLGRFRDVRDRLRSQGLDALNSFFEIQNELCVAVAILEDKADGGCTRIEYERPLGTCGELFDFEVEYRVGPTRWAEVKTIHPKRQDDWKKFARDSAMNRFPDGSQIILGKRPINRNF